MLLEAFPLAHAMQSVGESWSEGSSEKDKYRPVPHEVQLVVEASESTYFPASQVVQLPVAAAALHEPRAHSKHLEDESWSAGSSEGGRWRPDPQGVQSVDAVESANFPSAHTSQANIPAVLLVPISQSEQSSAEEAAVAEPYLPAVHAVQRADPDTEYLPISQVAHSSTELWKEADVEGSMRKVPAGHEMQKAMAVVPSA